MFLSNQTEHHALVSYSQVNYHTIINPQSIIEPKRTQLEKETFMVHCAGQIQNILERLNLPQTKQAKLGRCQVGTTEYMLFLQKEKLSDIQRGRLSDPLLQDFVAFAFPNHNIGHQVSATTDKFSLSKLYLLYEKNSELVGAVRIFPKSDRIALENELRADKTWKQLQLAHSDFHKVVALSTDPQWNGT
jgi:hypothetical protein